MREYEYEYKYLSHTKPKINMLFYIKVVKVRKIMHICAIVCNLWYLVEFVQTYTNTNIFGMHVKDEYEYEYIRVDKKRANTNTNIFGVTKKGEYEYEYEYSD